MPRSSAQRTRRAIAGTASSASGTGSLPAAWTKSTWVSTSQRSTPLTPEAPQSCRPSPPGTRRRDRRQRRHRADNHPQGHPRCPDDTVSAKASPVCADFAPSSCRTRGGGRDPAPAHRTRLGRGSPDELEPLVRPEAPADLAGRAPVRHHDVAGEIVLPTDQRRPDAVRVDRHAAPLELLDLRHREAAGGDDPDPLEAVGVERAPHLAYESLVHASGIEVAELVPQRPVDELARRVE